MRRALLTLPLVSLWDGTTYASTLYPASTQKLCLTRYRYLIVTPNNINAAGVVIQYWNRSVHISVWMGQWSYNYIPRAVY